MNTLGYSYDDYTTTYVDHHEKWGVRLFTLSPTGHSQQTGHLRGYLMSSHDSSTVFALLSVFLVITASAAIAPGSVAAQSTPEVTFGNQDITISEPTEVPLVIEDIPSDENVGSYELTIQHDSALINVSVAGTSRFDISTDVTRSDGSTSTSIVGYTDQTTGSSGDVVLASLTVTPTASNVTTSIAVSQVDSLTDTDGNALAHTIGEELSISTGQQDTGDDTNSTGGGGGGGGGVGPGGPGPSENVSIDVISVDSGATATVENVPANSETRINIDGIVSGEDIALEWIDVRHRVEPNDYRIEMTNIAPNPPDSAPSLTSAEPLGYLSVAAIGADVDSTRLAFSIPKTAVAPGTSVDSLVVYRYQNGWEALDTEPVTTTADFFVVSARSPGFSAFAIAVASPEISVTDATVETTEIEAGNAATVSATVSNDGAVSGSTTVTVEADGETLAEQEVSVAASDSTEVTLETVFDQGGEYSISVNGQAAGTLTVSDADTPANGSSDGGDGGSGGESGTEPDAEVPGFTALTAVLALLLGSLLLRRQ